MHFDPKKYKKNDKMRKKRRGGPKIRSKLSKMRKIGKKLVLHAF